MSTLEQVRDESYKRDIDKSPSGEPSQWIYNAGWDAALAHLSAQAGEFSYYINNPSAWEHFSQEGSDMIAQLSATIGALRLQLEGRELQLANRDKEIERLKNTWSSKEVADAKIKAAQLRNDLFSKEAELNTTIAEQALRIKELEERLK